MSAPMYSHTVAGVALQVFTVTVRGATQYQLYAGQSAERWELVGMFSEPVDAAAAVADWHTYLSRGGTLDAWTQAHPDGITPKISRARIPVMGGGGLVVCTCLLSCAEEGLDGCPFDGEWHVHPLADGAGFGPCPLHPDAPGDQ